MKKLIKTFNDGSILEYDMGSFDNWCVYITKPNQKRYAPKDTQYFSAFVGYSLIYGKEKIYSDFTQIYDKTTNIIEDNVLQLISNISKNYDEHFILIDILFTILYSSMVAEENKRNAKLGKRIKRLGFYQVLFEYMPPIQAAVYSKGKSWKELDLECKKRGF
jgi:hypothetical protein